MADESRIVKDPICGKDVDTLRARAVGIFGGVTYYFCSADCKAKYRDPRQPASAGGDWSGPERRVEPRPEGRVAAKVEAKAAARVEEAGASAKVEVKPPPKAAPRELAVRQEVHGAEPIAVEDDGALDTPARRPVAWIALVLTLLMAAGAVLLFTLRK
jgi:YHS domain-containing protein